MRLPTDVRTRFPVRFRASFLALGLTVMLAACGRGGSDLAPLASAADNPNPTALSGPDADFPVVLGAPYDIDGKTYTPANVQNHDEVGYAALDGVGGANISIAHRTLPLPSYVEITALETGETILARVDRRGPMTGNGVAALSPGAGAQLGVQNGAPVRLRRVNPPESDRASLRSGRPAAKRMATPKSLLAILTGKLPETGSLSLASAQRVQTQSRASTPTGQSASATELPPVSAPTAITSRAPVATPVAMPTRSARSALEQQSNPFEQAFTQQRRANTSYPLRPLTAGQTAATTVPQTVVTPRAPVEVARVNTRAATPPIRQAQPNSAAEGAFVVQAAAFASKANAERAANSIDGFVQQSGRFFRVRMGPFTNRGQAEQALAKVRAAGYSDARVFTAG